MSESPFGFFDVLRPGEEDIEKKPRKRDPGFDRKSTREPKSSAASSPPRILGCAPGSGGVLATGKKRSPAAGTWRELPRGGKLGI
jgi:hypothetical protein